MHKQGIAYGTPEELVKERARILQELKDKCEGGQIRVYQLWEIVYKEKYDKIVNELLPRPHNKILNTLIAVYKSLITAPFIGKKIDTFLKAHSLIYVQDNRRTEHHLRPDIYGSSPEFVIIAEKKDTYAKDGSENL